MDLTRQIIELLSEPPGSFIYHIVTLFALQIVFAISFSRWRRRPEDDYARNMSWAAAAIFGGRLILLAAGLLLGRDPAMAANYLPPLEQAVNTASVLLLVWALVPPIESYPRALDISLITSLVVTGVLYLFFAQEWQSQLASGETYYHGTTQATAWTMMQIAVLAVGLAYLLFNARSLGALPPIILGILLLTNIIHLWNFPEFVPSDTNVAYWVRLGNLIAIPLWAVYAYTYTLSPLLESESRLQDSVVKFSSSLEGAAQVIATEQPKRRLVYSLQMINGMFDTSFAAIGLIDEEDANKITFYGWLPGESPGHIKQWDMDLASHVTLNAALRQGGATRLQRDGLGSRQLYAFFEAADLQPSSSLLVHPLATNGAPVGMLVIPTPGNGTHWTEEAQNLVPGLAHFIAQALINSRTPSPTVTTELEPEIAAPVTTVPAAIVLDKVRLKDLEDQLKQVREEFNEAEQKRRQAEANANAAQKQARYLAAALRSVQSPANNSASGETGRETSDSPEDNVESEANQSI